MANEKQLIRSFTEPTIILDDIVKEDTEDGTSDATGNPSGNIKLTKQQGGVTPLVQIINTVFMGDDILYFNLNSSGDIPTLSVEVIVRDKSFYSNSYPKDGDIVSIFIRSKDDTFHPIRNDYDITSISIDSREGGGENAYETMMIYGKLRVPDYDATKCFSLKGTSMDALLKTATDLKLGFASNEVETGDEQVWLCPFEKTKDFIHDVTMSAWKDTKSFYSSFIDHFYKLNFVNVEPIFSEDTEVEESMILNLYSNDYGKDNELSKSIGKTIVTNWDELSGTPNYMLNYSLVNNAASINLEHGYKRYISYYDALIQENTVSFVDPITTPGAENEKVLLKGRPLEKFYLSQVEGKWMGIQYGENGENTHDKFNYAKVNNFQNSMHIKKMGLKLTLQNINFNIRRYQSIPVIIVIKRDDVRKFINQPEDETGANSQPNENEPNRTKAALKADEIPFTIDKTVSGFYMVDSISYRFEKGEFRQDITLYRREWPVPPSTK